MRRRREALVVDQADGLAVVRKLFERIVASPRHLLALHTVQAGEVLAQLRILAMRGGASVYAWEPEAGLVSLRESGLNVPGSRRLTDALRYVMHSTHFGVYLFSSFEEHLKAVDTLLLRRISRMPTPNGRKLVFVGAEVEVPEELEGFFDRLEGAGTVRPQLRLRDGRWVA